MSDVVCMDDADCYRTHVSAIYTAQEQPTQSDTTAISALMTHVF